MKKIILSALAIGGLLFAASCQMDESGSGTLTGEVDFTITAGIPGGISTYAPAGSGSHNGGAMLLDPDNYDLRYIMQAYDETGKLAYNATQYVSDDFTTQQVVFEARLIAKKYNFVFWADFVPEGQTADYYYKTTDADGNIDLRDITYALAPDFTDDAMDAYTKVVEVNLSAQNQNITDIKLQRPFGKLRLIATDQLSGDLQDDELPATTEIKYADGTTVPDVFNALTGIASGNTRTISSITSVSMQEDAVVGGTTYTGAYFLIANYIFASDANTGYAMDVTVKDKYDNITGTRSLSQIPIVKNKLTTVIGNFYSNSSTLEVIVEDPFEQPENIEDPDPVNNMKEALAEGGLFTLYCDIDITASSDIIVPEGITSTIDLNGYTIRAANGTPGNIKVYGSLTLKDSKDGQIVAENDYSSDYSTGIIDVSGEDASLTMEGGYIYAVRDDAVNNGQFGVALNDGADFTMTGGKIEAGWYAIAGNGNNSTQNSVIEIQGGELISTSDYAIYLPQSGTTNITGGTVNGAAGAVSIRRGTLNISGDAVLLSNGEGYTGDWGDGTGNQPNCGIMVDPAYGACTVNISGGTVSTAQDAIIFNQKAAHASESVVQVSAGTFSDPTPLAFLKKEANVKVVLGKDYSGPGLGIFKNGNGDAASVEIDLGGNQWTLNDNPLFGSTGTVSQYFHLEKDATVVFRNGTLVPENSASGKMLIQNYSNLTLDGVTITGGATCEYVVSNNNGSCNIINSTITATEGKCAFDVFSFSSYEGVTVTVDGESVIYGRVEFGGDNNKMNGRLIVNGGTFNGNLIVTEGYYDEANPNIVLNGGTFNGSGWENYR